MEGWSLVKYFNNMIKAYKEGETPDFIYGLNEIIEDNIDIRKDK